jgi:hypothetical protein
MPLTDNPLLFDEQGRTRGSFTSEWIITYKGGRVDGHWIVFSTKSFTSYEPEPSLTLLGEFIRLADGDDREITRFARKYGALGLCAHGLPSGQPGCARKTQHGEGFRESLQSWRHYAARARALLNLAAAVSEGRVGDRTEWQVLGSRSMLGRKAAPLPKPEDREYQRQYVAFEIRTWLLQSGAVPAITWDGKTPVFRLRAPDLIGVIGIALMSAVLRSGSTMICSACGLPYTPKRKPAVGKNHYCQKCGENKKAAKRLWARKQREFRRAANYSRSPNLGGRDASRG